MKPSEIAITLKKSIQKKWPIMIISSPGCGKSDIVEATTKDLGYDISILHPVVSDPTDAKGLPAIVNNCAEFLPFGELRLMIDAKRPLVVFLDDLGQASTAVQASFMQLLLARQINGKKISDHVTFVAATNGRQDGAGVTGILTALINRFRTVVELEIDANDWIQWALQNQVPAELVAYINFKKDMLSTFDKAKAREMKAFASPRSVKFLGDWINEGIMDLNVWTGCVGESFAVEFNGFYKIWKEVGTLIPQIIMNPSSAKLVEDGKPDIQFAVTSALAYQATKKNIDAIGIYTERYTNAEYRTFLWKSISARDKSLTETQAFVNWTYKHNNEIN